MLELKNISKTYATGGFAQKALDKVSVTFRDSEFVAVLGPSGSGKTTLLNVIGGLDHYDDGDLIINGVSTKEYKDGDWDHYRNNQVGFVFQNYNLIQHQTVLSNVELALTLSGISPSKRRKLATKALCDVGLGDHIKKHPNQLSGGQMQRVAIARAIVNNPNIIFADEPTGALDTKTSIQIMDILKEISKDRLVVMVTHNPEIAEEYATRIVNLKDGNIVGDSQPIQQNEKTSSKPSQKLKKGKTSMSFITALLLSFSNLMGKKGRTFMTAFAGSIGIIGISGILALSTGTNMYIKNVEINTLSQYPLSITRSKSIIGEFSDLAKGGGGLSNMIQKMQHNQQDGDKVGVRNFLTKMLATSGNNDLKSLKKFLDSNPANINASIDSIEYGYSTKPVIYANDKSGIREVFPAGTFSSMGASNSSTYTSASQNTSSGGSNSMSGFAQLPKDDSLYKDKYKVAAGRWPENANECVLVLHQDGTINDALLYVMGFRDNQEMLDALQNYSKDEKVNLPNEYDDLTYDQILGHSFKIINPSDLYEYNSSNGLWEDKSEDKELMKSKVEAAEDLKIVGIINAPEGNNTALALTAGINYSYELCEKCIDYAAKSKIIADQLEKPDIDILSGKTFAEEKKGNAFDSKMLTDIVEINYDAFKNAFRFDSSALNSFNPKIDISEKDLSDIVSKTITPELIEQIVSDLAQSQSLSETMKTVLVTATYQYIAYLEKHPTALPSQYFESEEGKKAIKDACAAAGIACSETVFKYIQDISTKLMTSTVGFFTNAITQSLSNISLNMKSLDKAFSVNYDALKDVFKFNLTNEKLMQISKLISGSRNRTFETNLSDFGYSDLEDPLNIIIYPNDFYAKERISDQIDSYNIENQENGHDEKVISYTDYAKLLMSSLRTMVDMITAVLVAFVAISLVVSSIMIGIITYISVLERRREIGILRAIGARKVDIFNVFNAETFIIGIVAGIIGIVVTLIGCIPANIIAKAVFNVQYNIAILPFWAAIVLILISVVLTLFAGLIPSTSAAKKDPVEAINS